MAAATAPTHLKGVVLCASFTQKPIPWAPAVARHFTWPFLFSFTGSMAIAKTVLAGHGSPEVNACIKEAHDAVPPGVMAARVRQVLTADAREELLACPVPILYLRAQGDRVVPRRNSSRIQLARPDVEVRTIPGPHIALATHAQEAAAEIQRFMGQITSG